jgi:hypothetical protein
MRYRAVIERADLEEVREAVAARRSTVEAEAKRLGVAPNTLRYRCMVMFGRVPKPDYDRPTKPCRSCGEEKPKEAFHADVVSKDGRAYRCKACAKLAVYRAREKRRAKA